MSPTTTPPDPRIAALVGAQAAARAMMTAQAEAFARQSAFDFAGWYDTDRITEWAARLAVFIERLQLAAARTTDAYLARVLSILTGGRVRPVGAVDVTGLRQGITHPGAYGRVADVYRWQQSRWDAEFRALIGAAEPQLVDLQAPLDAAVDRAVAVADLDIQLAARAQSQAVMDDGESRGVITGYRRVIHPELTRSHTCGLCVAASDRLYHARALLPIHSHCACTTLPVLDGKDPGSALNAGDLQRLYREAGSTSGRDLKRTRYQVDEHGELGPVLNPHGATVRTARQAARDTNGAGRAKTPAQRLADLERIRSGFDPALAKVHDLMAADPERWKTYAGTLDARIHDLDRQIGDLRNETHDLAA